MRCPLTAAEAHIEGAVEAEGGEEDAERRASWRSRVEDRRRGAPLRLSHRTILSRLRLLLLSMHLLANQLSTTRTRNRLPMLSLLGSRLARLE